MVDTIKIRNRQPVGRSPRPVARPLLLGSSAHCGFVLTLLIFGVLSLHAKSESHDSGRQRGISGVEADGRREFISVDKGALQ